MEEREQRMTNEMGEDFKYYAFISYSTKDDPWGKRLQNKLENYRLPAVIRKKRGLSRKPFKYVFYAPSEILPGGLDAELQYRLRVSRNLIVIGSPNSAKSYWVGKEIEYFHHLGRDEKIHYFIIDGVPNSEDSDRDCFHPILKELGIPEVLGANIQDHNHRWSWLNKEHAYLQLISKLLGVEFDELWKRHKRRLIRHAIMWTVGALAVVAALVWVWASNQPFDARLGLIEQTVHNEQLPPLHDAVVTLTLDNETKVDSIHAMDETVLFTNIPHRYMDKRVKITLTAPDFLPVDTTVKLSREISIYIKRDTTVYGDIFFRLRNITTEKYIPNTTLEIAGQQTTSDREGMVRLTVPLVSQQPFYIVKAPFPLINDTLYMPCFEGLTIQRR